MGCVPGPVLHRECHTPCAYWGGHRSAHGQERGRSDLERSTGTRGAKFAAQPPRTRQRGRCLVHRAPCKDARWGFESPLLHACYSLNLPAQGRLRTLLRDAPRPVPVRGLALRADARAVWLGRHVAWHPLVPASFAFPAFELDLHSSPLPWSCRCSYRHLYTS